MKLNLGSNDKSFPGFLSVDICPPADVVTDLSGKWPWADSSIDEIRAFDIIEHLPDRINTMNELHRVLKPGSRAEIEVPNATHGAGAFQDPTHCSYWTMNSFQYFDEKSSYRKRFAKAYGITARFNVISIRDHQCKDLHEPVWKIAVILGAVK